MTLLKASGAVDVSGAVALAFGVPEKELCEDMSAMSHHAPDNNVAFLLAAWEYLEGYIRQYPNDWNDDPSRTREEVTRTLRGAAAELDATII